VSASEDFWDDILGHLKERVLLPVIGPELVAVQDGDRRVTLPRLLGERIAARYQLKVDWGPESGLDEAVGAYLAGRGEAQRLYRVVNDLLSDLNPEPTEALRQLVGIGDFRVFISTTFDSLLARALNGVRFGAEARHARAVVLAQPIHGRAAGERARTREDDTVVFKVFGKVSSTPQYALHDEDILEWLHTLLTETARLPEWLNDRLKESPVLFLGCQLSDWVGRLLTRMTSNSRLSLASKQFFIVGQSVARYPALTRFSGRSAVPPESRCSRPDPSAFVAELHDRWRQRATRHPLPRITAVRRQATAAASEEVSSSATCGRTSRRPLSRCYPLEDRRRHLARRTTPPAWRSVGGGDPREHSARDQALPAPNLETNREPRRRLHLRGVARGGGTSEKDPP
jgi:SIR2-like domain